MYLTSFRLRNLYRGRIIAEGSPRIDHQFSSDSTASVRARLRAGGAIVDDGQRIVLYAPTLRGEFASPTNDVRQVQRQAEALQARLDPTAYRVLLKLHPQVTQFVRDDPALRTILVPPEAPANVALAAADVLVTDYSSIFVDQLASNRPVLFFRPDVAPDASIAPDAADLWPDWSAPTSTRWPPGSPRSTEPVSRPRPTPRPAPGTARARTARRARASSTSSSAAAPAGTTSAPGSTTAARACSAPLGPLGLTDVTTAGLNLLDAIDHARFDVTVCDAPSTEPDVQALIARLNPNARQLPRLGPIDDSGGNVRRCPLRLRGRLRRLVAGVGDNASQRPVGLLLELAARRPVRRRRQEDRGSWREPSRRATWSTADESASWRSARPTPRSRHRRIKHAPAAAPLAARDATLPAAMDQLLGFHSIDDIREEVWRTATIRTVLPDEPGVRTFVTVGPLTAASNHKRLLRAFDRIHQVTPNTRLIIIGTGGLDETLEKLVVSLGLASAVIFAGEQDNPYGVMARSDCFVLSGERGGEPMIVLEARRSACQRSPRRQDADRGPLPDGYGHVVAASVDALADAMRKFLAGKIKPRAFDYEAYNRLAVEEFYRAIGATD